MNHKKFNIGPIARANAKSIANQLTKVINGLAESKVHAKKSSGLKSQNGHEKSDKVHSAKAMDNFRSVSKNYFQHIKDTRGGKIEKSINAETAKDFVRCKLSSGEIKGSTANTYLSILEKAAEALKILTGKEYISKNEFRQLRSEIKSEYDLRKEHHNRGYENVQAIQKEMNKFSDYALSSRLQIKLGLRRDDAINSAKWRLNDNGTLTVINSKAGISYQTAPLSSDLQKEVDKAIKSGYKVSATAYSNDLKIAVIAAGEVWSGKSTHGLRYSFAQQRLQVLIEEKESVYHAKAQLSLEMGHSRLSITDHYTKFE